LPQGGEPGLSGGTSLFSAFAGQHDSSEGKSKVPFVLPKIDISTFTGRNEELCQLEAQLLDASGEKVCSIVGLSGSGGMGKSALAFHFATLHRERFLDGVIGLPVDGKTAREIACDFARVIARYDGKEFDEEDDRSAAAIMQEVFAHRRMLLIFDNADRADLKALRPGGQRCALIVTTRDRMLPNAFDIPDSGIIDLPPLPNEDARQLLRRILGTERVEAELEATDRIIEITGSLPLALQIIGSTLRGRQRSLVSYAESLQQEQTRLQRLQIRGDQDLNVTASLNLSLASLEECEIDLFACLSVCAKDGFSLQTAMVAGGLADEWETQDLLERLYQLSLLNEVSANRYVFHALVRVYAAAQARERNLWEIAAQRHAEYFIDLVQSNNVTKQTVAPRIAEDFDDILQAAEWMRLNAEPDELKESAYRFALKLRSFFYKYGYSKKAVELMAGFQTWAEQLSDWNASAKFKVQHAKYLALEGRLPEAEAVLRTAQDSIDRIGDLTQQQENQAKQLSSLGGVLQKQGKFDEAIAAFERQISVDEALNDQVSLAIALNRLGGLLQQKERFDEAIAAFKGGISIAEALNDQKALVIGLNCLGGLLQQQGKFDEAIATFERETTIDEALNEQKALAIGLNRLGGLLQQKERFDEAIAAFERQIGVLEALDEQKALAITLNRLGGLLQQQGKFDEAIATFERGIKIAEALNEQKALAITLNRLGGLLQQQGKFDEAIAVFERETMVDEALNDQASLAIVLNRLGGLLQQKERFDEAIAAFERQIGIAEALNDQTSLSIGLNCLGGLLQQQGKFNEAIAAFERQISIAEALNDQASLSIGLNRLGGLLQQQGKFNEAIAAFKRQIGIAEALNDQASSIINRGKPPALPEDSQSLTVPGI